MLTGGRAMAAIGTRRSVMTLYDEPRCPLGHAVRIVLAEKGVNVQVSFVGHANKPEDLNDLNPYGSILTLVDRDLVLYEQQVMLEYLDERFPHPPLLPVDPVARANNRQLRRRVARELYALVDDLQGGHDLAAANARKVLRDNLTAIAPAFAHQPYFLSEEFTLADCCMLPLLWRLDLYGVKLPAQAKPIGDYAARLFARPTFKASLSPEERAMRRGA